VLGEHIHLLLILSRALLLPQPKLSDNLYQAQDLVSNDCFQTLISANMDKTRCIG
jgi:hypothetical protein